MLYVKFLFGRILRVGQLKNYVQNNYDMINDNNMLQNSRPLLMRFLMSKSTS